MKISNFIMASVLSIAICSTAADSEPNRGSLSQKDYKFAADAAKGSLKEVHMGEMAQQLGSSPAVKNFGMRMIEDHGKASKELETILSKKGAALPDKSAISQERDVKHMHDLKGANFDRAYSEHMVTDHKKDIKDFEKASTEVEDPDLKDFAAKTLPILKEHLKMAEDMQKMASK